MRDIKRGAWLIAIGISMLCAATYVRGEVNAGSPSTDVRGCYAVYNSNTGSFLFEPFLKVADKEAASEDGDPEIWGFRPWNLEPPDKDGKTHPVNLPANRFIPLGTFKEVPAGSRTKSIKCPDGLWATQ